jgi:hypothetical protein
MNPRIVAVAALLALAVGLAAWLAATRPRALPAPPPTTGDPGALARAQQLAQVESLAIKNRWIEEPSGIDLAPLAPAQRELFLRFANAERCTCGCGYTLAGCRASDMSCDVSGPHLAALLDSVRTGAIRSATGIRERPVDLIRDD